MSVPLSEGLIPAGVLMASLAGSGHCISMCGGLVATVAHSRVSMMNYHLGRLGGYLLLGGLAGAIGEIGFAVGDSVWVSWMTTLVLALGFFVMGVRVWRGQSLHLFRLPPKIWSRLSAIGPTATGLMSAFLPCGWLHVFVLGAVATRSVFFGSAYLFVFWMGTLPALSFAPLVVARYLAPLARVRPRLSSIVLIMVALGTIGVKMASHTAYSSHSCHEDSDVILTEMETETNH